MRDKMRDKNCRFGSTFPKVEKVEKVEKIEIKIIFKNKHTIR